MYANDAALDGEIQMDFKSDRISDFMVYYLSQKSGKYENYKNIPLSEVSSNVTDCLPWMVGYVMLLFSQFEMFCVLQFTVTNHLGDRRLGDSR